MSKKTNAMRFIESNNKSYDVFEYDVSDQQVDGLAVANKIHQPIDKVFKTLVLQGQSRQYYVAVIPVELHLDLKKMAGVCGEKKVELIALKDLLKITGYIRGGCSPFGMKKSFPTVVDELVYLQTSVIFSGGKLGLQVQMPVEDFIEILECSVADITMEL